MRIRVWWATAAVAAVVAAGLVPAGAATPGQPQTSQVSGLAAMADWSAEPGPEPDSVTAVTVKAFQGTNRTHSWPGAPTTGPQAQTGVFVQMGMTQVSCVVPEATADIASDLSTASMAFGCVADVVVFDEQSGEPTQLGTMPLQVAADWTATGGLVRERNRYRSTDGTTLVMERGQGQWRLADAQLRITGPDGVLFEGASLWAQLAAVRSATLLRGEPMAVGGPGTAQAVMLGTGTGRMTFAGRLAVAQWFAGDDPPADGPRAIYVQGAEAGTTMHMAGGPPTREDQPSVLAMALPIPGFDHAEVWAIPDDPTLSISRSLTSASLSFQAEGAVLVYDPATGEEVDTGLRLPLEVSTTWTGTGPLVRGQQSFSVRGDGMWSMSHVASSSRDASARITVTGPAGTIFDGPAGAAELMTVRDAQLSRG